MAQAILHNQKTIIANPTIVRDDDRRRAILGGFTPTGSLEPSASDVGVIMQLKTAEGVIRIALLDHIVFNGSGYSAFWKRGVNSRLQPLPIP